MSERRNTVLLFSKVPEPGLVKTRLSVLKDGMFPPETAAELYECMLLDVVEIICAALDDLEADRGGNGDDRSSHDESGKGGEGDRRSAGGDVHSDAGNADSDAGSGAVGGVRDTYELVVSTTPAANVAAMEALLAEEGYTRPIAVIADEGESFGEHYNHAFSQCWERGSDCVLSMGADMPALTKADIRFGFDQLHRLADLPDGGIVLAPDQEMGVSVVGWTRGTTFDHSGVFYNADGLTVLPAYIAKARERGLPALWLPPIPDVDTMADFIHNVTLVHALCYCAAHDDICPPYRTAEKLIELGFRDIRVAPNDLRDPRGHIDR